MRKVVECFYPGSSFPAISISGGSCALNCKHCSRRYLEGMIPARSPSDLVEVAASLAEKGAKGFLLSGGSDASGKVPIAEYARAIETIKSSTDLLVNAHVGLAPARDLERLVSCGVDAFSTDVYGSDETIREVLGLGRRAEDYFEVVSILKDLGAKVAPHLCVGIHGGRIVGEFAAIERLSRLEPEVVILISLIPTKGTAFESSVPPSREMMIEVVQRARSELPNTRLVLGCMRSKKDRSWELDLIHAGLDGIVMPSTTTVSRLREEKYEVRRRPVCCAFVGSHL